MNLVDRFLYKLAICCFLLFAIVGLHKLGIIDYHKMQEGLSNNINLLKVVKAVNGESSLLLIDFDDVQQINTNLVRTKDIKNGKRVFLDSFEAVEALELGIVVKVENDKVYLMDLNDNVFCYSNLTSIDVDIYQIIRKNQIIGKAAVNDEGINYYDLFVSKKNKYIDWYS